MSKGTMFWLGIMVGIITSFAAFENCFGFEEIDSNGDKAARKIPEEKQISRE